MKTNLVLGGAPGVKNTTGSGDSRVQRVTPARQCFAPGDTVSRNGGGRALPEGKLRFGVYGLFGVDGTGYNGSTYQASFTIPNEIAGTLELVPQMSDSTGNTILGVATTIAVRPTTAPLSLALSQANDVLTLIGDTDRIHVTGTYSGDVERDLTSSAAGTTYKSSKTKARHCGLGG